MNQQDLGIFGDQSIWTLTVHSKGCWNLCWIFADATMKIVFPSLVVGGARTLMPADSRWVEAVLSGCLRHGLNLWVLAFLLHAFRKDSSIQWNALLIPPPKKKMGCLVLLSVMYLETFNDLPTLLLEVFLLPATYPRFSPHFACRCRRRDSRAAPRHKPRESSESFGKFFVGMEIKEAFIYIRTCPDNPQTIPKHQNSCRFNSQKSIFLRRKPKAPGRSEALLFHRRRRPSRSSRLRDLAEETDSIDNKQKAYLKIFNLYGLFNLYWDCITLGLWD